MLLPSLLISTYRHISFSELQLLSEGVEQQLHRANVEQWLEANGSFHHVSPSTVKQHANHKLLH